MSKQENNNLITIACKNGRVFSACLATDADDEDFLAEIGWYVKQGCILDTKKADSFRFESGDKNHCDHCKEIDHNHPVPSMEEVDY